MSAVRRPAAATLLAVVAASAWLAVSSLVTPPATAAAPAPSSSAPSSAPAAPAAVTPTGPVKFYVVQATYQGQPEFLFEIALRFLGSGDRNAEIFELNKGRLQPDGLRLTRADEILPGWVLRLPPDATGPEVRTGLLPTGPPAAPSAAPSAPSAPTRAPAGAVADSADGGPAWWVLALLAVGGALLVACVVVGVSLWRRGELAPFPRRAPVEDRTPSQVWASQDRLVFAEPEQEPAPPSRTPTVVLAGVTLLALAAVGTAIGLLTVPDPAVTPTAAASPDPRFGPRITSRDPGLCLTATTTSDGAPLILATCNGTVTQQWQMAGDGTIRTAEKCMDVAGASTADNAVVQLAACNGNRAQQFAFDADRLVSKLTGNCVDVADAEVRQGGKAVIHACAKVGDRTWQQLP